MKKFICLCAFCCLLTSIFAEMNFAPSLGYGIKLNNPSTGIEVYTKNDKSFNLIKWAGLESTPNFVAIDFDFEWYDSKHPFYLGIATGLDLGSMFSCNTSFKLGIYNNYINLFCKVGTSGLIASMNATELVGYKKNDYGDYCQIDSITFYGIGYNFGIGLDLHPTKGPFFIRLSYDHEIYNPDLEIKTLKFTDYIVSEDVYGDRDFHNRAFTISVGWQFGRKNIIKQSAPEDKNPQENVRQISFNYVNVPTMTDENLLLMVSDALINKGITVIGKPFFTNEEKLDKIEDTLM